MKRVRRAARRIAVRMPLPRSVRGRLALVTGGVILVSGGVLVLVTFVLGTNKQIGPVFVRRNPIGGGGIALHIGANNISVVPKTPNLAIGAKAHGGYFGGALSASSQIAARVGSASATHSLFMWSLVGLGIVTVLGLALGWGFSGRMLRPLRNMRETAQQISEKNLGERLALAGPEGDELKELGDTIDALLGRLEGAFEAQRRFVQNASHELRTPITMMRTSLDVATSKPRGAPAEVAALATKLNEGLDQAERLLEGFLSLARAQSGNLDDLTSVSLADAAADALATHAGAIEALELRVEQSLADAVAAGSATLVPQVADNLIQNAVRHNEPGGWLRVTTSTEGDHARLAVENSGPRLDPAWVATLGQPFHRLVDRTSSDRGAGLGLSIVAAIVAAADGSMVLTARPTGGLRADVALPVSSTRVRVASR